ncbi:hypothetical protein MUP38_07465, partial [Candidatus Bathyarchaeota archaeon]|nr:hypothetical protein [Candidatus Bathyarchaeota archaeon]
YSNPKTQPNKNNSLMNKEEALNPGSPSQPQKPSSDFEYVNFDELWNGWASTHIDNSEVKELSKEDTKFILHQLQWKGQTVVRDIPVTHWYLTLTINGKPRFWEVRDNPIYTKHTMAVYHGEIPEKYNITSAIKLKPGEFLNPLKKLEADWRMISSGQVYLKNDRANGLETIYIIFPNKETLGGHWVLRQEERNSEVYSLEKAEPPMQKFIRRRGDKWIVVSEHEGKTLGTHSTYGEALRQLQAIEASKHRAATKENLLNHPSNGKQPR